MTEAQAGIASLERCLQLAHEPKQQAHAVRFWYRR